MRGYLSSINKTKNLHSYKKGENTFCIANIACTEGHRQGVVIILMIRHSTHLACIIDSLSYTLWGRTADVDV